MRTIRRLWPMLLFAALLWACAHPPSSGPAGPGTAPAGAGPGLLSGLIGFYQGPLNHLQAVRRGPCPMVPSCSEYARRAITDYFDRLFAQRREQAETLGLADDGEGDGGGQG